MAERANIKVSRETYERHNARRKDMGVHWDAYLDGQAPEVIVDKATLKDAIRTVIREELDEVGER